MHLRSWRSGLVLLSLAAAGPLLAQSSTKTYTYDALGRLIVQENEDGSTDGETYSLCYDEAGNRSNYKTTDDGTQSTCVDDGDSGSQGGSGGGGDPPPPPPGNNPPNTVDDEADIFCDGVVPVNLTNNDTDPESDYPLSLANVVFASGVGASVQSFSATSATIDAGPVNGDTTFTYTVQDSLGNSSIGTLTITTENCGGF